MSILCISRRHALFILIFVFAIVLTFLWRAKFFVRQFPTSAGRKVFPAAPTGPTSMTVHLSHQPFSVIESANLFDLVARKRGPPTDKVGYHTYQVMYGAFLMPLVNSARHFGTRIKLFEIGMGCHGGQHFGKSVSLWQDLLGINGELWEAEHDSNCIENARRLSHLKGVNVVTGDQQNSATLKSWVKETGGQFDVIIDDGAHSNTAIMQTFLNLFDAALKPGGLYFIEDLSSSRHGSSGQYWHGEDGAGEDAVIDVLMAWIDQLLSPPPSFQGSEAKFPYIHTMRKRYPLPIKIKWIFCQFEACVISKCEHDDANKCKPPNARNPPE